MWLALLSSLYAFTPFFARGFRSMPLGWTFRGNFLHYCTFTLSPLPLFFLSFTLYLSLTHTQTLSNLSLSFPMEHKNAASLHCFPPLMIWVCAAKKPFALAIMMVIFMHMRNKIYRSPTRHRLWFWFISTVAWFSYQIQLEKTELRCVVGVWKVAPLARPQKVWPSTWN